MQNQGQEVERSNGQLSGKLVADPPDLEAWREKLFNVDETILLTHEEYDTFDFLPRTPLSPPLLTRVSFLRP